MSKQDLKARIPAPHGAPVHIAAAAFGVGATVELRVKVSAKAGVRAYGFAFGGAPVVMSNGQGRFFAPQGQAKRLEWVMVGEPGGTMQVTVTQDGAPLEDRQSKIAPPYGKGYDAFDITAV
jgi:hypothetical protein